MSSVRRLASVSSILTGNKVSINAQADQIVQEILNNPNRKIEYLGDVFDVRIGEKGKGLRFYSDGMLKGLLEPNP